MAAGCCTSAPAVDGVDEAQLQRLLLEAPLQAGQVEELHQRRVCCVRCCEAADCRLYSCIRCRLKCPDRFTRSVPRAFKLESRVGVLLPLKHPTPNIHSIHTTGGRPVACKVIRPQAPGIARRRDSQLELQHAGELQILLRSRWT